MAPDRSHQDAVARLRHEYFKGISDGHIIPFVYPIATLGAGVGLLFFLIPPTSRFHCRLGRYAVFLFIACWHAYLTAYARGLNPATSFGVGCISTFGTMWAALLLVFHDAKATFRRIKRVELGRGKKFAEAQVQQSDALPASPPQVQYYWQPYPASSLVDRIYWILDIWTNFRLMGWDHKVSGMPSYPEKIQVQLDASDKKPPKPQDVPKTRAGLGRYDSFRPLIKHNLWLFVKGYLILDLVLTLTHHDPYFRGEINAPPPANLPRFMKSSPNFWVRGYRLTACMIFIWLGLRTILVLAPLCFVGVTGGKHLGIWSEPWLYPDHFASYTVVFERGLRGWWGQWWHQSFRAVFEAGSGWIVDTLGVQKRSLTGTVVVILTSFVMSGLIHASGSKSQQGQNYPASGPMAFFLLQPIGLALEMYCHRLLSRLRGTRSSPWWLASLTYFVWVHFWFWLTAPLLADDMARGGLWLMEMVPFSPMRALGFGTKYDKFFCWQGPVAYIYRGRPWISTGIAL